MRRFVNGDECILDADNANVRDAGDRLMVSTSEGSLSALAVSVGETTHVSYRGRQFTIERQRRRGGAHHDAAGGEIRATMPGQVVDVAVSPGDTVTKGQPLAVIEAMKTHQPFAAPYEGTVVEVKVARGDQVSEGQLLVVVEER